MVDFRLPKQFDVVMCLFSAIGYANTEEKLRQAIRTMTDHLLPGGILVVEPWLSVQEFRPGAVFASFVDQPDLKVARINTNILKGTQSVIEFHYLVGTPAGVEHFTELHELGLYSADQYRAAFAAAGLETSFEKDGLIGRGIFIGIRRIDECRGFFSEEHFAAVKRFGERMGSCGFNPPEAEQPLEDIAGEPAF